jgi:AraC-like DNA-binding protein
MADNTNKMTKTINSSVVKGWAVAASHALDAIGLEGDELLKKSGVDLSQDYSSDVRYSSVQTRYFWSLALKETQREDIGLHVAKFVNPITFHAVGFSMWASATLYDALNRMVTFDTLLNDGCSLTFTNDEKFATFSLSVHQGEDGALVSEQGVDYFLAAVVKILTDMQSTAFSPVEVSLQRAAPKLTAPWLRAFNCPVNFASADNQIVFDLVLLNKVLPTGDIALATENDKLVSQYIHQHQFKNTIRTLEAKLVELMPTGVVAIDDVSQAIGLNARSLQYKLAQSDTSFTQVLNKVRHSLAKQYLQSSDKSINEIAYLLGFSEPSHFNRAFKRWRQQTPSNFRLKSRN